MGFEFLFEDLSEQFLGGGFPVAPRNGEDGDPQLFPVVLCQFLQGLQGVLYDDRIRFSAETGIVDHCLCRSFFEGLWSEPVSVESFSPKGEKELSSADLPGIRLDPVGLKEGPIEGRQIHGDKKRKAALKGGGFSFWGR